MADELQERVFSADERKGMAEEGKAMPDGSFPIENESDLKNAIQAIGRAKDPAAAKAHIKKRAKALGMTDSLPEGWKESRAAYFADLADLRESVLDEASYVAQGVTLIKPGFSKNTDKAGRPRYYPPDVLKRDAVKFEGVRSYANHPRKSDEKDLPERDIKDITGYFENVRASDDGTIKADYRVVGSARQWLWPMIQEAVTRKPDLIELSINALGETSIGKIEGRDSVVIESIVKGNSVDNVTSGAAGGTFKGALLASDPDQWTSDLIEAMPFEQWRSVKPEYVDKLKAEWKTIRETEALKESQTINESLQSELAALQEKYQADTSELVQLRRASTADRILKDSGLPFTLREAVRDDLLRCEGESAMLEVIQREKRKFIAAPKEKISIDSGNGKPVTQQVAEVRRVNPATVIFGLNESRMPKPNESAEEYKARIANQ